MEDTREQTNEFYPNRRPENDPSDPGGSRLEYHLQDYGNPHRVTARQVGALDETQVENIVAQSLKDAKAYTDERVKSFWKIIGVVDTVEELPDAAVNGNIYFVRADSSEYIWLDEKPGWELLGTATSLEGYATEEWVSGQLGDYLPLSGGTVTGKTTIMGTTFQNKGWVFTTELSEGGKWLKDKYAFKAHTHAQSDVTGLADALAAKQDTLTAGEGIDLCGNVISAAGGDAGVYFDDIPGSMLIGKNPNGASTSSTPYVSFNFTEDNNVLYLCGTDGNSDRFRAELATKCYVDAAIGGGGYPCSILVSEERGAVAEGCSGYYVAIGAYAYTSSYAVAIGAYACSGSLGVAIGYATEVSSEAVAIGYNARAYNSCAIAIGRGVEVTSGIAIGYNSRACYGGVALGSDVEVGDLSIAIGSSTRAKGRNSAAFGAYATVGVDPSTGYNACNATVIGVGAYANMCDSTTIGATDYAMTQGIQFHVGVTDPKGEFCMGWIGVSWRDDLMVYRRAVQISLEDFMSLLLSHNGREWEGPWGGGGGCCGDYCGEY